MATVGETRFALSGKPDVAWPNNIENDYAKPRTADAHNALKKAELPAQVEQTVLEKDDDSTTTVSADTPLDQLPTTQNAPRIASTPLASPADSLLLRLPLEIRLQIYRWVMLLGTTDRASGVSTPNQTGSSSGTGGLSKAKTGSDSTVSVSSALFHCMPPYFFDSPQHFGPGDGIMFLDLFSARAHQTPLEYRSIVPKDETPADGDEPNEEANNDRGRTSSPPSKGGQLLAAYRPVGRALPVGLLASCRQIYGEARFIAFETSEFVFVRLFASALSTAHAFVVIGSHTFPGTVGGDPPRLRPWQRDHLRYMRLELDVSVADMAWRGPERDPKHLLNVGTPGPKILDGHKWLALCSALRQGLHGLRILLNITEERHQRTVDGVADEAGYQDNETEAAAQAVAQSALVQGFLRLAALRQLEIELVWVLRGRFRSRAANMSAAATRANLAWCASVEKAINTERQRKFFPTSPGQRPVSAKVICVERIYDEEKKM